jgi:methylated-DNA-[protein]-cysteine S-methyltransferase
MPMPTPFQQRVYDTVCRIPRGKVSTYRLVARHIGCASSRAVGQALRCNPFAPGVPCHRVIASDLSIGGFRGARGGRAIRDKLRLLDAEGVRFERGILKDESRVYAFRRR